MLGHATGRLAEGRGAEKFGILRGHFKDEQVAYHEALAEVAQARRGEAEAEAWLEVQRISAEEAIERASLEVRAARNGAWVDWEECREAEERATQAAGPRRTLRTTSRLPGPWSPQPLQPRGQPLANKGGWRPPLPRPARRRSKRRLS